MKPLAFIILLHVCLPGFAQVEVKGKWNLQLGVSSNNGFTRESNCINIRYVSPRFKWSEEWNLDEETQPDKYRNMRIMVELMYAPPFKVIYSSINAQYRLIRWKRFTTYVTGGLKVLFVSQ